jgi:hypothetical protein
MRELPNHEDLRQWSSDAEDSLIEIVRVAHDGKHEQTLSVRKDEDGRYTWCSKCGEAVYWERTDPDYQPQEEVE